MKDWVTRHPLSSYFLVAYAVSWSIAVPLALQAQGVLPERLPWSLHYLAAFGPAAAALLIPRLLREPTAAAERAQPRSVARGILWWTVGFGSPLLEAGDHDGTRLIVRNRAAPGYRFHGLPMWAIKVGHFVMQRKQLIGIARRAEHWGNAQGGSVGQTECGRLMTYKPLMNARRCTRCSHERQENRHTVGGRVWSHSLRAGQRARALR